MGTLGGYLNMSLSHICNPEIENSRHPKPIVSVESMQDCKACDAQKKYVECTATHRAEVIRALQLLDEHPEVSADASRILRNIFSKHFHTKFPKKHSLVPKAHDIINDVTAEAAMESMVAISSCSPKLDHNVQSSDRYKRQHLKEEQVIEIYMMRPKSSSKPDNSRRGSMLRCKTIAPRYQVRCIQRRALLLLFKFLIYFKTADPAYLLFFF